MGIVVDGVAVPSAPPAQLVAGHVVASPDLIAKIADRVVVFPDGGLNATRGSRACGAELRDGMTALAPLARCLGARVVWEAGAKTLALDFAGPRVVRTHAPFDPRAPQVAPTTIFTPEPPTPTPRVVATGVPHPRRTPIPATPSFPLPATGSRPTGL